MKTCVFAGTFDPFTAGHEQIVLKALKTYQKVVVVIGVNPEKVPFFTTEERIEFIKKTFNDNPRVEVCFYDGLMMNFMRENGYTEYIRGIRGEVDMPYEEIMRKNNLSYNSDVNTIYITCQKEHAPISSSMIRECLKEGKNVLEYLPKNSAQTIIDAFNKKQA